MEIKIILERISILLFALLVVIFTFFALGVVLTKPAHAAYPTHTSALDLWNSLDDEIISQIFHTRFASTCENIYFTALYTPEIYELGWSSYYGDFDRVIFTFHTDPTTCEYVSGGNVLYHYTSGGNTYLRRLSHSVTFSPAYEDKWISSALSYGQYSLDRSVDFSINHYKGTNGLYKYLTSGSWDGVDFGTGYGGLGTSLANSSDYEFSPANWNSEPTPTENYDYHLTWFDDSTEGYYLIEFNGILLVDPLTTTGQYDYYLNRVPKVWEITNGYEYTELDGSNYPDYPGFLQVDDLTDPCENIRSANFTLKDTNGQDFCVATNPHTGTPYTPVPTSNYIDDIFPPYAGAINFDPTAHDWGTAGNWFKPAFEFMANSFDDFTIWGYNVFKSFAGLFILDPNYFDIRGQILRNYMQSQMDLEGFEEGLATIEAFAELSESDMPIIQGEIMGQTVNLVDFTYIDDNIGIIRPILVAILSIHLLFFNINQVNKLLSDNKVLD